MCRSQWEAKRCALTDQSSDRRREEEGDSFHSSISVLCIFVRCFASSRHCACSEEVIVHPHLPLRRDTASTREGEGEKEREIPWDTGEIDLFCFFVTSILLSILLLRSQFFFLTWQCIKQNDTLLYTVLFIDCSRWPHSFSTILLVLTTIFSSFLLSLLYLHSNHSSCASVAIGVSSNRPLHSTASLTMHMSQRNWCNLNAM